MLRLDRATRHYLDHIYARERARLRVLALIAAPMLLCFVSMQAALGTRPAAYWFSNPLLYAGLAGLILGRPVIGSVESIASMTRNQLHSFHVRRYTPDRMVVAVAGNIDHDQVVSLVRRHFRPHLVRGRKPVPPRKG